MLFLKKAALPPPLVLLRAKNDVDVNDDDVEEAAMMMTTTRGNPMNFISREEDFYVSFEKKTPLSLSLSLSFSAFRERDEERDRDGTRTEQLSSPLLQFFVFNSLFSSLSSSFGVMNKLLLLAKERIDRNFLPRELEKTKKCSSSRSREQNKKPEEDETTEKKAFR